MTRTLLVAGTASHVGKSTIVAGICRIMSNAGIAVAPFKAQNMSNNAQVVLAPDGTWGEIGVSQYAQCQAARMTPTTDVNPVLLKPRGETPSQLIIDGKAHGHFAAGEYYEDNWEEARQAAIDAYERLTDTADVIIAEGAGSIAEINLHDRDLANIETAEFTDADIVLVVDIERGGAFASAYGTIELLPQQIRSRVVGVVINKFRGDVSLLDPGIESFERRTGVPILGVLPYADPGLPAEDNVSLQDAVNTEPASDAAVRIAVPNLPRLANWTDLETLERTNGVDVSCVPLAVDLDPYDAVIIPGTKNTVDDALALKRAGFATTLRNFDGPIIGICGGYQLLGEELTNAAIEGTGRQDEVSGAGLLPVQTQFVSDKRVERVTVDVSGSGPIAGATGSASGYVIHMGRTTVPSGVDRPLEATSCSIDSVLGTYLHGLFDNENIRNAFLECVWDGRCGDRPAFQLQQETPYKSAASLVAETIDMNALGLF